MLYLGSCYSSRQHSRPAQLTFFVDHTHTQFTKESKMATALTPQTDVTFGSHVTNGEPEIVVSASLQKIKSIKNPNKHFYFLFFPIKSETSDSFVSHFDSHFAYLKTLDFCFNVHRNHKVY